MKAPVIVFAFNRVDHLRRTFDALMENIGADEAEIFVYVDKPADDDVVNIKKNKKVVEYLLSQKEVFDKAFKRVEYRIAEKRKGVRVNITSGISEVIHEYGRAIMVEDDILTAKDFLKVMDDMLEFYEQDERVFTVGGYSEPLKSLESYDKDVYAIYRTSSWGWGTWADRFDTIDFEMSDGAALLKDKALMKKLKRGGTDLPGMIHNQLAGLSDAWDIQATLAQAMQDRFTVLTTESRVINMGLDNSGVHCSTNSTNSIKQQPLSQQNGKYHLEIVDVNPIIMKDFYKLHSHDYIQKIKRNLNTRGLKKIIGRLKFKFTGRVD